MLRWAFMFLMVGLLVGLFGFTGIAGASYEIAKLLFFLFLALFFVMAVLALTIFLHSAHHDQRVDRWHP